MLQHFSIKDEYGNHIATIETDQNDTDLRKNIKKSVIDHYCADKCEGLSATRNINSSEIIGRELEMTGTLFFDGEGTTDYDLTIEVSSLYTISKKSDQAQNLTVNVLELASELADKKINDLQNEELKNNNSYYPNGIVKELENKDVVYTEEAQEDFNSFYSEYENIIKKCEA